MLRIALIGDHDPRKTAHIAIPQALALAGRSCGVPIEGEWIGTARLGQPPETLAAHDGLWIVPGSPYADTDAALAAIRFAREAKLPLLGTCGGFQHALIEFARDVAGIAGADHAETNAAAADLVVTPLSCALVEKSGDITFTPGSRLHDIFRGRTTHEGYHCRYGVNPAFRARFEAAGLRFTGFDDGGEIRTFELPAHPFFIGTLFQPERSALRGLIHPLVEAFVRAAAGG
jgi:CTP synthase (UTP-ammonia lyase)